MKRVNNFAAGFAACTLLMAAIIYFFITPQFDRTVATMQQAVDTWKNVGQQCRDKYEGATVLYEPRASQSGPEITLKKLGPFTLNMNLAAEQGQQGQILFPAWVIPAKVAPQSRIAGVEYQWFTFTKGGPVQKSPLMVADRLPDQPAALQ